jgi:hypothetical protein
VIISEGNFKDSRILSLVEELSASISCLRARFCISEVEPSDSATAVVYISINLSIRFVTSGKCEEKEMFALFPEVFWILKN